MDNDLTTANALFNSTAAGGGDVVTSSFTIFQTFYTEFFTPFQNGANAVMSALIGPMSGLIASGATVMLLLWASAMAFGAEDAGSFFGRMITRVLVPAAIAGALLSGSGTFQQWVTSWVIALPDQLNSYITGGLGGTQVNSGSPFDGVWNKAFVAGGQVMTALPISLRGAVLMLVVVAYWIGTAAAVSLTFAIFLASKILMYLLAAISPIFVACGAFQHTRFLLKGFVSAAAGTVVSQIVVAAILGIAITVLNTVLEPLTKDANNADLWGMVESILTGGVALFFCAILAWKTPAIAVGIAGGVFDSFSAWTGAGGAMVDTGAPVAQGAGRLAVSNITSDGGWAPAFATAARGGVTP